MYTTSDDLYSLYVVDKEDGKVFLREISVPDSDIYQNRRIPIGEIMAAEANDDTVAETLEISHMMMEQFKLDDPKTSFLILSNKGIHKIGYEKNIDQASIDKISGKDADGNSVGFIDILEDALWDVVVEGFHKKDKHEGENAGHFATIA